MGVPLFSKQIHLTIDGSTVASATDFNLNVNRDTIEIATLASTQSKQTVPDLYGYTIGINGLVFRLDTSTEKSHRDLMANMTQFDTSVNWVIVTDVSTTHYYSGYGYINSLSYEGGVGSAMKYSCDIQGSGNITITKTV